MRSRTARSGLEALTAALLLLGCRGEDPVATLGAVCNEDARCASGLCLEAACADPEADEDGDGLPNAVEAELGTKGRETDSDGDGKPDGDEYPPTGEPPDTDGDGKLDVVESATGDADSDCIADERDANDAVAEPAPDSRLPELCRMRGPCGEQRDRLRLACVDLAWVCDYSGIEGFAEPEAACDGRDEDCDGAVDDEFPDWDGDGVPNCEPRPRRAPMAGVVSGGGLIRSETHTARLVIGPPMSGAGERGARHVRIGVQPLGPTLPPAPAAQ